MQQQLQLLEANQIMCPRPRDRAVRSAQAILTSLDAKSLYMYLAEQGHSSYMYTWDSGDDVPRIEMVVGYNTQKRRFIIALKNGDILMERMFCSPYLQDTLKPLDLDCPENQDMILGAKIHRIDDKDEMYMITRISRYPEKGWMVYWNGNTTEGTTTKQLFERYVFAFDGGRIGTPTLQ